MGFTSGLSSWDKYLGKQFYMLDHLEAAIDCIEDDKLRPEVAKLLTEFCYEADREYDELLINRNEFEGELEEAQVIIEKLEEELEPDYKKQGLTGDEPMLSTGG